MLAPAIVGVNPLSTTTYPPPVQSSNDRLNGNTGNNNHGHYQHPQGDRGQVPYLSGTPACVDGCETTNAEGFTLGGIQWPPLGQVPFRQEKARPIHHGSQPQEAPTARIPTSPLDAGLAEHGQLQQSPEYVLGGQSYWSDYGTSPTPSPFPSLHQNNHPLGPPSSQQATPDAPSTIQLLPIFETAMDRVYRRQSEKGHKQDQSYH